MLEQILRIAAAYASLGDAIQTQVRQCEGVGSPHQPTPGASDYIRDRLIPQLRSLSQFITDDYDRETYETEVTDLESSLTDRETYDYDDGTPLNSSDR